MIQQARVRCLNDLPAVPGRYVLYWMQASQRTSYNHALEYAIEQANALGQPLVVCFGLMDDYPEANLRHYAFMLEGLDNTVRTTEQAQTISGLPPLGMIPMGSRTAREGANSASSARLTMSPVTAI